MSTDGEAAAAAAYEAGGAGGKFRKRQFRRTQATPYDRPPTALRNRNPSWLTKLVVDPASKLINAGAQRFFAPLFRKRLPPPPVHSPPTPEKRQESGDVLQDSGPYKHSGVLKPKVLESGGAACSSDVNTFSELEQSLKQKTLTRSEIDQLMKLLHSKVIDSPMRDCDRIVGADYSTPAPVLSNGLLEETKTERLTSCGVITTPVTKIHENDVASPAELAKSYMGSRKVSPSMLSLRSQSVRQEAPLLKMVPYASKSPMISLANRPMGLVGISGNGFNMSRSRGRSAIYSMARKPYSRVHATDLKGGGSMNYVFGGPSSSQSTLEHDESFGSSKQVSGKRRSSVLDNDLGSYGPIRRTRQKPNILSHEVSGAAKHHLRLSQEVSNFVGENHDNRTPSTSRAHVPNKSSETAAKILEQLDKLTPKKSSESKLPALKEKSPSKLTSMLDGQGIRILEDSDSSKLLQNGQDSYKSENHSNAATPDFHSSGLPKVDSIRENGPKKLDMASPLENNNLTYQKFVAPDEEHAYKQSAYEDVFHVHHDVQSIGSASEPVTEVITKPKISFVGCTQFVSGDKASASPEVRTPPGFLSERTNEVTPGAIIKEVKISYSSTTVDAHHSPEVTQSASASDQLEQTDGNKILSTGFSQPSITETKGPTSTLWNGSKPESSSSLASHAPDPTNAQSKRSDSDDSRQADNNGVPLVASITSSTTLFSSISAPSTTSSLYNGNFSPISSTSVLASSNYGNHSFTNSPSEPSSSTPSLSTGAMFQSSVDNAKPSPFSGTSGFTSFGSTSSTTTPFASSESNTMISSAFSFTASSSEALSTVESSVLPSSAAAPFRFSSGSTSMASSPETKTLASFTGATPGVFNTGSNSMAATLAFPSFSGCSMVSSSSSFTTRIFSSSSINATPGTVTFAASSSPSPTTGFTFGSSSSLGASSIPAFTFAAVSSTSASPENNDQMNMEDSMVEDPVHSSGPTVSSAFGQSSFSSPSPFLFGQQNPATPQNSSPFQATLPQSNPFQVGGGQQNPATSQNSSLFQATFSQSNPFQVGGSQQNPATTSQSQSPFQAPDSLGFSAGGSFSIGSGSNDKSGRKYVKVSRHRNRKK